MSNYRQSENRIYVPFESKVAEADTVSVCALVCAAIHAGNLHERCFLLVLRVC